MLCQCNIIPCYKRSRIPRKFPFLGFPYCAFCPPQWQVSFCKEEYAVDHSSQQALCNSLIVLPISGVPILSTSDKHLCGNHLFDGASVSLKDTASYYTPPQGACQQLWLHQKAQMQNNRLCQNCWSTVTNRGGKNNRFFDAS